MIVALDTNILLDILFDDQNFSVQSQNTLETLSQDSFFVISPEVYSELISAFQRVSENPQGELDEFLDEKSISLSEHTSQSLGVAGRKWHEYANSDLVRCPSCGDKQEIECKCGEKITWRNHIITDFMIGGHAETEADKLVTRDEGYFQKYFDVDIVNPGK